MDTDEERYCAALIDMLWQFAYRGEKGRRRTLHSGGLSALEHAFGAVGWRDPHYVTTESTSCDHGGCYRWATGGGPTPDGYKHCCSLHHKDIPGLVGGS